MGSALQSVHLDIQGMPRANARSATRIVTHAIELQRNVQVAESKLQSTLFLTGQHGLAGLHAPQPPSQSLTILSYVKLVQVSVHHAQETLLTAPPVASIVRLTRRYSTLKANAWVLVLTVTPKISLQINV
jgi:hypothetical protein